MKLKNKIVLAIIFILFALPCFSQGDTLINKCVKNKVILFFNQIKRYELEKSGSVNILEIVNKKPLGFNQIGIYLCSDFASHHQKYLMLKYNNKIKILNSNNSAQIINEVSSFLIKMKSSDLQSIEYLKAAIELLDDNSSKIADNLLRPQKWITCKK